VNKKKSHNFEEDLRLFSENLSSDSRNVSNIHPTFSLVFLKVSMQRIKTKEII